MELEIIRMSDQGVGIGVFNNKIVFVPNAVEGDIVIVKIVKDYKNYCISEVVDYIKYSDNRIKFDCPYAQKCGGCQIANLNYENQAKYKKNKVENILKKFCKLDQSIEFIKCDNIYNYRNKVTLHVKNGKVGYYEEKSNKLIEINKCKLLKNNINTTIKKLKNIDLKSVEKIVIRENDDKILINFIGNLSHIDLNKMDFVDIVYINGKKIKGDNLYQSIDNMKFKISHDAFFQVNIAQMKKLYDVVRNYMSKYKDLKVLDLFCGTGTIGIYISDLCKSVKGIEINENAIKDANENKIINKVDNIVFVCNDVFKEKNIDSDLIIVDPPRNGLNKNIIEMFKRNKIGKIIYISCNPITFARDLNLLKDVYDVIDIKAVDMFPNTYHVECVCILNYR